MQGQLSLRAFCALLVTISLLSVLCAADAVSDLGAKGRPAVDAAIAKSTTCTKDRLQVRREWSVSLTIQRTSNHTHTNIQGRYHRL
jgi:tyrosinase